MELPSTGSQRPSSPSGRSAAASAGPDIRALGPLALSLIDLTPRWVAALERSLGVLPVHAGPATVALRRLAAPPAPVGERDEAYPGGSVWRSGPELVVRDDASGCSGGSTGAGAWLADGPPGLEPDLHRLLPPVLAQPLLGAGVHLVHGAAVGDAGGALLVVGPSGAGKSTTTVAARAAGLHVLADDLVLVWEDGGTRWVQGIPRPVWVPAELEAHDGASLPVDRRGRVSPPGWLWPGRAPLVGVVLPRHAPGAARLAPADAAPVGRQLVAGSFAAMWPAAVPQVLRLVGKLGAGPLWDLGLAADRRERVAAAHAHLLAALGR
ncbi:hypothetical protein KSP35_12500 [Aquihabitans sp. G128]|uniref:hypothetical protein n=1 Tax=Aquihabitans sp. G128 TaxID=2849779 RepID=UPI001C2376EA|nr:hypothetical protein [Aquihabitans sp. G128]QXC59228.1 hypothetical protein KSP35_12500 [Aquihabitans sp. G128]